MNEVPFHYAFLTVNLYADSDKELTKEESLLKDQAARTLKEYLRYMEMCYQKCMADMEKKEMVQ